MATQIHRSRFAPVVATRVGSNGAGKFKCTYRGCARSFKKAQALRMHIGRAHENTIVTPSGRRKAAKLVRGTPTRKLQAARRVYRHKKQATVAIPSAHYCPGCGLDLDLLRLAMATAGRLKEKE